MSHSDMIALHISNTAPTWRVPLQPISIAKEASQVTWLVKGLLPDAGLAIVFGASNSGKTFFTLDMALALATGQTRWLGHRCTATGVIYLALEGNLAARIGAWEREHDGAMLEHSTLAIYSGSLDLFAMNAEDIAQIADDMFEQTLNMGWRPGLLIVDTLVRAAPGADENSVKDMSRVIENLTALGRALRVCVLVVHHSGKNQDAGMRGSSALLGAADQVLEVRVDRGSRMMRVYKSRDASKDVEIPFDLKVVDLGVDEDGEPITSCVLASVLPGASGRLEPPPKPSGANQKLVYKALWDMLPEIGRPDVKPAPDDRPSVSLHELIERATGLLTCEPRRAPERVRTAVSSRS